MIKFELVTLTMVYKVYPRQDLYMNLTKVNPKGALGVFAEHESVIEKILNNYR